MLGRAEQPEMRGGVVDGHRARVDCVGRAREARFTLRASAKSCSRTFSTMTA